jgi:uncharacterized membrane protein YjjP (DUF1212 family)
MSPEPLSSEAFAQRVRFVSLLARRLHQYGTAAQRLEAAIEAVGTRLGLAVEVWSNPTGILLSFSDPARGEDALAEYTQVIRLDPGENDLRRLCEVDRIAYRVREGELGIVEGTKLLRELAPRGSRRLRFAIALGHGVAAAAVAALLKTGWIDIAVAACIGTLIGFLGWATQGSKRWAPGYEALSALLAGFVVAWFSAKVQPIAVNSVLISSLIVLVPGLMLTTAVNELANQQLVAGSARFAGAAAILLKLAFGTVAGLELARALGYASVSIKSVPVPLWTEWAALGLACLNFALLFKAAPRDIPVVALAAMLGYVTTRVAGAAQGAEFGVFMAGLVVGMAANAYARWRRRPGALVRVPGIILLVPGSVGFRSLFFVFEGNVERGLDTAISVLALLLSLVAGLLFANVLVAPRKTLS